MKQNSITSEQRAEDSGSSIECLVSFLSKASRLFGRVSSEVFTKASSESVNLTALQKFSEEPDVHILFVSFSNVKETEVSFRIELEKVKSSNCRVLMFYKREGHEGLGLKDGVGVYNLGSISDGLELFRVFQETLSQVVIPVISSEERQSTEETMQQTILSKVTELEASLGQRMQSSTIPELDFNFDSRIRDAVVVARERGRVAVPEDVVLEGVLDRDFVNILSEQVNKWTQQGEMLTHVGLDRRIESVNSEIGFWSALFDRLSEIRRQLRSPEVRLTLDYLQSRKRVSSLSMDTMKAIDLRTSEVEKVARIMKELNFSSMMLVSDHRRMHAEIVTVFNGLKRLVEISIYPASRIKQLVETMTRDFIGRLVEILRRLQPLTGDWEKVKEILLSMKTITLQKWESQIDFLRDDLRNKRRQEVVSGFGVKDAKRVLVTRVDGLLDVRGMQSGFKEVIGHTLRLDDVLTRRLLELGFPKVDAVDRELESLVEFDPLDFTPRGDGLFQRYRSEVEACLRRQDERVVFCLKSIFDSGSSTLEQFQVFERCDRLLERPSVRSEMKVQQEILLREIAREQSDYFERFKSMTSDKKARFVTAKKFRIPGAAFSLLRAEQLLVGLRRVSEKLKVVLGDGWMAHPQSRELTTTSESLANLIKQSMDSVANAIRSEYDQKPVNPAIYVKQEVGGDRLELKTGLPDSSIVSIKGMYYLFIMRNELSQKFLIRFFFRRSRWPAYIANFALSQSVRDLNVLLPSLTDLETALLCRHLRELYKKIEEGARLVIVREEEQDMDDNPIERYASNLEVEVFNFRRTLVSLRESIAQVDLQIGHLKSMDLCSVQGKELNFFKEIVTILQESINALQRLNVRNLRDYINQVNSTLEESIGVSLQSTLGQITRSLTDGRANEGDHLHPMSLSVRIDNGSIFLEPSLAHVRSEWINRVQEVLRWPSDLARVSMQDDPLSCFDSVVQRLSSETNSIKGLYEDIEGSLSEVEEFFRRWTRLSVLWEIDSESLLGQFPDDWMSLVAILNEGKSVFETREVETVLGKVAINFRLAKRRVSNKFEVVIREVLSRIGSRVASDIHETSSRLTASRDRAEDIDFTDVENIIDGIEQLSDLRTQLPSLRHQVTQLTKAEEQLFKQPFLVSSKWQPTSMVQGQLERIEQTVKSKEETFEAQREVIKARLRREEESARVTIAEIQDTWSTRRPFTGQMHHTQALDVLSGLGTSLRAHLPLLQKLNKANQMMGLRTLDLSSLFVIEEESLSLKELWTLVAETWKKVDDLLEQPVRLVQPSHVMVTIEQIHESLLAFPRKYASFEIVTSKKLELEQIRRTLRTLTELRSDAIQEQHWETILQRVRLPRKYRALTVGDLHRHGIATFEKLIGDIVTQAQGELVLRQLLSKMSAFWTEVSFTLVSYRDKCQLIKGWDDLNEHLENDLSSLSSMKLSSHFVAFEEEVKVWTSKLTEVQSVLLIWAVVQRKWVYLEGVFTGATDIQQQLPSESARFRSVDSDFTTLMRRSHSRGRILDIVTETPNLKKSLDLLNETLEKIQKALSEFLERQRISFARFYFVGDDDLLEIVGGGREVGPVQKHFQKMFAGIASIGSGKEGRVLQRINSREGEGLPLRHEILIEEGTRVDQWLTLLEEEMRHSIHFESLASLDEWKRHDASISECVMSRYCVQALVLGFQLYWTFEVEDGRSSQLHEFVIGLLSLLAEIVMTQSDRLTLSRLEQMITELVHKRDVTHRMKVEEGVLRERFTWTSQLRFYLKDKSESIEVRSSNASFDYSYEYQGMSERLVQTPLTDRCFLTLTQALYLRMGGAPFGPAGTGKTESVKALGQVLGRFVLVFNCDETFNFSAMGRIFIGLCQVGSWGCFDEFNRLEERILSAVSQQILSIQTALRENQEKVELLNRSVGLSTRIGIFITMNPGYAGRSNLPENLKQLFRQMAMVKPDRVMIAQVTLYSQGFRTAPLLAGKVVSLFELCASQLSKQSHYDFGLRALKSVLCSAGGMRSVECDLSEQDIILCSFRDSVAPKLVSADAHLLEGLIRGVFPGSENRSNVEQVLLGLINAECDGQGLQRTSTFVSKVVQLNQILKLQLGVMLVGQSGSGKSRAWRTLLASLEKKEGVRAEATVIDPKAFGKEELYGVLDPTTMEWTDGVFTSTLRRICSNNNGELERREWIVFDGDVDPEWAENLNSVLDDNRLLTLPNGERLTVPQNVKLIFEVESLRYATLATVSRCGMVWFSDEVVTPIDLLRHFLDSLTSERNIMCSKIEFSGGVFLEVRRKARAAVEDLLVGGGAVGTSPVLRCLETSEHFTHVMQFSKARVLGSLFGLLNAHLGRLLSLTEGEPYLVNENPSVFKAFRRSVVLYTLWSLSGDLSLLERFRYYEKVAGYFPSDLELPLPSPQSTLIDFTVTSSSDWIQWQSLVPSVEVNEQELSAAETVIVTVDTLRHQHVLCSWLEAGHPFIICGPPGSGKTMTLMSTLKGLPDHDMIFLNFSASTTTSLVLKQFEHYGEYVKAGSGLVLRPKVAGRKLILFCDEINLPDEDKYGTQAVISFLRQLTEQGGFWRPGDHLWVSIERITFVGACNPPTDAGRHPLSQRLLRHCPVLLVDFPGHQSLLTIYGTFTKAMLAAYPEFRSLSNDLTNAMVDFYTQCQTRFTPDQQPHYIFSPRELTRWKHGVHEAIVSMTSPQQLVRLWAHEGLRIFADRLVLDDERQWCEDLMDKLAQKYFKSFVDSDTLSRPILFSPYLSKHYSSVDLEPFRDYVRAKLVTFAEENTSVQLVLFDSVLEHIIRIDRILRQPLGHCLLVGSSGVGKTTLARYVAWMNGQSIFQIKPGKNYGLVEFDINLREVMKKSGCKGERVCFIFDESNILSVSFMERMNALLAGGEIPGLFEGEELVSLLSSWREHNPNKRHLSDEEIYHCFTKGVQRNLHVAFTMNPSNSDFSNRSTSSPAIFNRCVIDWFGDWSHEALLQVANELTSKIEFPSNCKNDKIDFAPSDIVVRLIVQVHEKVRELASNLRNTGTQSTFITPRDFLDFIKHFVNVFEEKRAIIIDQERHLRNGLEKLAETETSVKELDDSLARRSVELTKGEEEANSKMNLIVVETKRAEERGAELTSLLEEVDKRKRLIEDRSVIVNKELEKVAPALETALQSLSLVTKKELDDIRVLNNPPELIRMTLTAVCYITEGKELEWKEIQGIMKKSDFLTKILDMKVDRVSTEVRTKVAKRYVESEKWVISKITNSYKSAGLLAQWLTSQLEFGVVQAKVEPLQREIASLTDELSSLENKKVELEAGVRSTEALIEEYKSDYSSLIERVQQIKTDITSVNDKVMKSRALLVNLGSEKHRWQEGTSEFVDKMSSLTGDSLRSAAFLTYFGFLDQSQRSSLDSLIRKTLEQFGLRFKSDLSLVEFLSNSLERSSWKLAGLSSDDLCVQNAIIINRHNRFPMVIDPTGQALTYMTTLWSQRKLEMASYTDPSFLKTLERCLRFGLPMIALQAERLEPILNTILNREVSRVGGRRLIRVGDQEIDFNSSFVIYLHTKDSDFRFSPDLCSRVTFVNFTVTKVSLEDQCLNLVLVQERPDVEKDRSSLLKLQGEYVTQLRELEEQLLHCISEQRGSILEDQELIVTLENLKRKSDHIALESKRAGETLQRVETTILLYRPVAIKAASVYFLLLDLASLSPFYQFSFAFFQQIFQKTLKGSIGEGAEDNVIRCKALEEALVRNTLQMLKPSLFSRDQQVFDFKVSSLFADSSLLPLFSVYLKSSDLHKRLIDSISRHRDQWLNFCGGNGSAPLTDIPSTQPHTQLLRLAASIELSLPESLPRLQEYITSSLAYKIPYDNKLEFMLNESSESVSPVFLYLAPGFDPSHIIDSLARTKGKKVETVAIGSSEGFKLSEKLLDRCAKNSSWLVLKNVHLALKWLPTFIDRLIASKPHPDTRVFLLAEQSDHLPLAIIRNCLKITFEPPHTFKSSVLRTLKSMFTSDSYKDLPPRLAFQLTWLHCIIMERLKYCPKGWSKSYEFSEADFRASLEITLAFTRTRSLAETLVAVKSLLINNIYGGKIDNEFDQKILVALVTKVLDAKVINGDMSLVKYEGRVIVDRLEGSTLIALIESFEGVVAEETPEWIGLPESSSNVLKLKNITSFSHSLQLLSTSSPNAHQEIKETLKYDPKSIDQRALAVINDLMIQFQSVPSVHAELSESPVINFFISEYEELMSLVLIVTQDLIKLKGEIQANEKSLSRDCLLMRNSLMSNQVPKSWGRDFLLHTELEHWTKELIWKIEQTVRVLSDRNAKEVSVALGLSIYPESLFISSKQLTALKTNCSIDELFINVELSSQKFNATLPSILLTDLFIEGASITDNGLVINNGGSERLSPLRLSWIKRDPSRDKEDDEKFIQLPLYRNDSRRQIVASIPIRVSKSIKEPEAFYESGCAIYTRKTNSSD